MSSKQIPTLIEFMKPSGGLLMMYHLNPLSTWDFGEDSAPLKELLFRIEMSKNVPLWPIFAFFLKIVLVRVIQFVLLSVGYLVQRKGPDQRSRRLHSSADHTVNKWSALSQVCKKLFAINNILKTIVKDCIFHNSK